MIRQKVNLCVSFAKNVPKKQVSAAIGSILMLSRLLFFFQPGHIDKVAFVRVRQSLRLYIGWNVYHPTKRPEEIL